MYVMLRKEYVEDLYRCLEKNMDSACSIINTFVHDNELAAALEEKFREVLYYFKRAYNPELVELKRLTLQRKVYWFFDNFIYRTMLN